MVSGDEAWGYAALAAAGIGYAVYRRHARTDPAPPSATPPAAPDTNPEPEPAPVADDVPDPAGDRPRAALPCSIATPKPEPESESELPLRRLDTVHVRCEDPTHPAGQVPAVTLARDRAGAVRLTLQRQGWTNTPNATLCPVHNPLGRDLAAVHARCELPGCGERAGMRLSDLTGAFSRLAFDGWRNRGQLVVCPYCSGVRQHRNW